MAETHSSWAAQVPVVQDSAALVYAPVDPGLAASHPACADCAEMELELVKPGSGAEAEKL